MYFILCMIIFVILLSTDQITKALAYKYFKDDKQYLNKHIVFTYLENKGGFSGFLANHPIILLFINIFAILLISIFLIPQYVYQSFNILSVFIIVFLAGACGNLCDRIFRGHVIDFIYFKYHKKNSKVFNLADFLIFGGMIGMIVGVIIYGI